MPLKQIIYTSLFPKVLKRREIANTIEQIEALSSIADLSKIVLATAHEQTKITLQQQIPEAIILSFDAFSHAKYKQHNPDRHALFRRFEIIPGKEMLRLYSAQQTVDFIYYTDSDQWVSPQTLARAYAAAHINEIVRIPVGFRCPDGPDDCGPQRASTQSDAFNCYIMRPKLFAGINLLDLTNIHNARNGDANLLAPDNTFYQKVRPRAERKHDLVRAYTRHHVDDRTYWEYLHGSIRLRTV